MTDQEPPSSRSNAAGFTTMADGVSHVVLTPCRNSDKQMSMHVLVATLLEMNLCFGCIVWDALLMVEAAAAGPPPTYTSSSSGGNATSCFASSGELAE